MSVTLRVGDLYTLNEHERSASKSEFCPWALSEGRWRPEHGFVDVKPFQHGLLCVSILEGLAKWQGRNQKFKTGIFLVGEKFVAICSDYIEVIQ